MCEMWLGHPGGGIWGKCYDDAVDGRFCARHTKDQTILRQLALLDCARAVAKRSWGEAEMAVEKFLGEGGTLEETK